MKREKELSIEAYRAKFKPPPLATHILSHVLPEAHHSILTQYDLLGSNHEHAANSSRSCGSQTGSFARPSIRLMHTGRLASHANDIIMSAPAISSSGELTLSTTKLDVRGRDRAGGESRIKDERLLEVATKSSSPPQVGGSNARKLG